MARLQGKTVFLRGAAPGDLVEARDLRDRGRFLEGDVVQVLEPGPDRRIPPCRHAGVCGGCPWQHLNPLAQSSWRRTLLEEALSRLGKFTDWPPIEVVTGPEFGFRNRAQMQPGSDSRGGFWGWHRAGTREVLRLSECPVLHQALQGAWELPCPSGASERNERRERVLHLFGHDGGRWMRKPGDPPVWAEAPVGDGRKLSFLVDGFFQSNLGLLSDLVARAVPQDQVGGWAIDLYAGCGLFSGVLEKRFDEVDAVESDVLSLEAARVNVHATRIHAAKVEQWLASQCSSRCPDLAVVDPPRQGLSGEALRGLVRLNPREIRYVSCAHDTLARDLRALVGAKWSLDALTLVDLYPQTAHLETVAVLRR